MKSFEERYVEWIDGLMNEDERADFEAGLEDREAALREREDAVKLGRLLRSHASPAKLAHADFLNSQALREIRRAESARKPQPSPLFPIRRLVFSGAFCIFLAAVLGVILVPRQEGHLDEKSLISQVISARAADPALSTSSFDIPARKASVIWVQGMEFIPADELVPGPKKKASEPGAVQ